MCDYFEDDFDNDDFMDEDTEMDDPLDGDSDLNGEPDPQNDDFTARDAFLIGGSMIWDLEEEEERRWRKGKKLNDRTPR